ncbi:hypothetical protein THARTR1_10461 [Trichoderma harzianum]|uniref:Uncharacterized protein n=1 Tax=Trichoderma harzianum TaxID=5544 RepID=A0A2K0TQG4_TRIHA|nr:hypothetical protein THARTR1_10461 [Trichoderma harzianum]
MVEWRFKIIQNITSKEEPGTAISPEWQMWDMAYFKRVSETLADPRHTAKLMAEGCDNGDPGELNCTKTCNSAEYMFRSPQNLWNCMTLSTVAMKVIPKPTNDTVNQGSEKDMDDMFHFGSLRDFDQLFVFRKVRECMWQSCSDSKYGKCTDGLFDYQCTPIHQFSIENFGTVLSERYCSVADPGFDFDLVGQGVSTISHATIVMSPALTINCKVLISYIMQQVLVIFFCLSFGLTCKWTRKHIWARVGRLVRKGSSFNPSATRNQNTCPLVRWFVRFCQQFPSAIISTLMDLQEAQTLFAATISIATIVAFHCYMGLANIVSISSYVLNNDIAHGVIIIGMSPLLLLQLCLHASEQASTYTLVFVFLNWLFVVVKSALQKRGAAGFEKTLKRQSTVPACGDNPGAMSYCMNYDKTTGFTHIKCSLIFAHLLTFLLLMDWALATLHGLYEKDCPPNKGSRWACIKSRIKSWIIHRAKRLFKFSYVQSLVRKKVLAIGTAFVAIVPMALGLADLVQLYKGMRLRYAPEGGLPWSFGQVTAVAVWFPVVCKFLYYCGVEDGVQARIDKEEYVVSRRETAISESKSCEEPGLENDRLIGPAVPSSMVDLAEPVEMRASVDTLAENLFMRPHASLNSDMETP